MNLLNLLLASPEVFHVLFAVGGAALGWWVKNRQGDSRVPSEVADIVHALLERRRQRLAQSTLLDLAADHPIVQPAPTPVVPPAR